ncbi:MAG: hypothetical protein M1429_02690 [Patescibacteria group bacterium]|nr:hypothetical protein [Patescibacteria group bacterium]
MESKNKRDLIQKKYRLPDILKPLAEKAKKYKSAKKFTYYVYGDITWYQFEQIGKLTNKSYGIGAYKDPAINAPKDFYNLIMKGEKCADL